MGDRFTTDVLASTIFKNYQAGFYGLSTAGNVVLFLLVTAIVYLYWFLRKRELRHEADPALLARRRGLAVMLVVFVVPFGFIALTAVKDRAESARLDFSWPSSWHVWENLRRL